MRVVNMFLFVIPCERVYTDILGRMFLETLDVVSSTVYLKMKYHIGSSLLVFVKGGLRRARLIHKETLKNALETIVALEERKRKVDKPA